MVSATPPAKYSYNLGETNRGFSAGTEIGGDCHGSYNGGQLHEAVEAELRELEAAIGQAIIAEVVAQTEQGNTVTLVGFGEGGTDVEITDGTTVTAVEFLESHGRAVLNITVGDVTVEGVRFGSDTAVGEGRNKRPRVSPAYTRSST